MSKFINQEKEPSLFDLIDKADGGIDNKFDENGYIELPNEVNITNFLSKLIENKDEIRMQNWGDWGVNDIDTDDYGKEKKNGILMPTIKLEKENFNLYLGITGGIGCKELHYHFEKK